jgi:hypothetical protein
MAIQSAEYDIIPTPGAESKQHEVERYIGYVKRIIRTIRASIDQAYGVKNLLPSRLNGYMLLHAVTLTTLRVCEASAPITPAELVHGTKVTTDQLMLGKFGRLVIVPITKQQQDAQDSEKDRGEWGMVVGFEPKTLTNRRIFLLDIMTRRYYDTPHPQPHVIQQLKDMAIKDSQFPSTTNSNSLEDNQLSKANDNLLITEDVITREPEILVNAIMLAENTNAQPTVDTMHLVNNMTITQALSILPEEAVHQAVEHEINNLSKYKVWSYMEKQDNIMKGVLPSKLFLKVKYKPDGSFDKLKARLVCGGHRQPENSWTRSPSTNVDPTIVLFFLTIAHLYDMSIVTTDIPSAFLNAPLKEKVHMRLSSKLTEIMIKRDEKIRKFVQKDNTLICELHKCIYGLHQAPFEFSSFLNDFLQSLGFTRSCIDRCVFF